MNDVCLPWFFSYSFRKSSGFLSDFLPSCVHSRVQHMPDSASCGPAPFWAVPAVLGGSPGQGRHRPLSVRHRTRSSGAIRGPKEGFHPSLGREGISRHRATCEPGLGEPCPRGTHRSVQERQEGPELGSSRARAADFGCLAREPDSGSESWQFPIGHPELPGGPEQRGQAPLSAFCQSHRVRLVSQQPAFREHLLRVWCAWYPSSGQDKPSTKQAPVSGLWGADTPGGRGTASERSRRERVSVSGKEKA